MSIVNATDSNFRSEVEEHSGEVLLDFWAPWCGPCKMQSSVLEELSDEIGNAVKIVKVNVDENPESADKYSVRGIPNLIILRDGKPVHQVTGYQSKEQLKTALGL